MWRRSRRAPAAARCVGRRRGRSQRRADRGGRARTARRTPRRAPTASGPPGCRCPASGGCARCDALAVEGKSAVDVAARQGELGLTGDPGDAPADRPVVVLVGDDPSSSPGRLVQPAVRACRRTPGCCAARPRPPRPRAPPSPAAPAGVARPRAASRPPGWPVRSAGRRAAPASTDHRSRRSVRGRAVPPRSRRRRHRRSPGPGWPTGGQPGHRGSSFAVQRVDAGQVTVAGVVHVEHHAGQAAVRLPGVPTTRARGAGRTAPSGGRR